MYTMSARSVRMRLHARNVRAARASGAGSAALARWTKYRSSATSIGISPACRSVVDGAACGLPSGLKWPPALIPSAALQSPFSWMWKPSQAVRPSKPASDAPRATASDASLHGGTRGGLAAAFRRGCRESAPGTAHGTRLRAGSSWTSSSAAARSSAPDPCSWARLDSFACPPGYRGFAEIMMTRERARSA